MTKRFARIAAAAVTVVALCALAFVGGCTDGRESSDDAGAQATSTAFPSQRPDRPVVPAAAVLDTPTHSVESYLRWISFAYRVADSDVATQAFSANEEVRVNSYVQLNKNKRQAIDQRLVGFEVESVRAQGATATVIAAEQWEYRYISMDTGAYSSPAYSVQYRTEYTVLKDPKKGWLVDGVQVQQTGGELK